MCSVELVMTTLCDHEHQYRSTRIDRSRRGNVVSLR